MPNNDNSVEKIILGNKVDAVIYENGLFKLYSAKSVSNSSGRLNMICKMTVPSEEQRQKISEIFSGDKAKIEKYISENIEVLKTRLDIIKNISCDEKNAIAPIYDYEFIKNPDGFSYDLNVHTCYMLPIREYADNNGITVSDALKYAMQILNACSYAASNGVYHGYIDTDLLFVDSLGKCKVFGFAVIAAINDEAFNVENALAVNKTAEIAAVSYCLYKFFNYFRAPFEYKGYSEDMLNDISQKIKKGVIGAPGGANEEICNLIFRGFIIGSGEYVSCEEYAIAVGRIISITDKIYLGANLVSSEKTREQETDFNSHNVENPNFAQQTYYVPSNNNEQNFSQSQNGNNSQYTQNSSDAQNVQGVYTQKPVSEVMAETSHEYPALEKLPKSRKRKSKWLIALIIILSLLITATATAFVLWKLDVISLSFIPGFESSDVKDGGSFSSHNDKDDANEDKKDDADDSSGTDMDIIVKIPSEDVSIDYGQTISLPIEVEGCSLEDLTFESSDESIVTVSNDGTLTAIEEGTVYIYIYDSDGNDCGTVNVVVKPKPDKIDVDYIQSMLPTHSDYGLYIYDIADRKEYLFDSSHNVMGSSALVCLPILYTYGYALDQGAMTESTDITYHHTYPNGRGRFKAADDGNKFSVKEIVTTMLAYGDNNCMNSLMNCFGIDKINEVCQYAGIDGVDLRRNLDPNPALEGVENKITAYACGQIMDKLMYDNDSPGKDFMNTYFRMSDSSARNGLAQYIPYTADILNHNAVTSEKYNEVIYVKDGSQEYVIVFLSLAHHQSNQINNVALASNIGKYVYESFAAYNN